MSAHELTMSIMRILPADVRARLGTLPHTVSALDASKPAGLNILVKDFAAAPRWNWKAGTGRLSWLYAGPRTKFRDMRTLSAWTCMIS